MLPDDIEIDTKEYSWLEIEQLYRTLANKWLQKAEKFDRLASSIPDFEIRKLTALTRASGKCAVQAAKFFELADKAKDMRWQEVASEKLAQLQDEEVDVK